MESRRRLSLEERVELLETEVGAQAAELRSLASRHTGKGGLGARAPVPDAPERAARAGSFRDAGSGGRFEGLRARIRDVGLPPELAELRGWEWWLSRIGVGLLLLGVAFLFKYAVDRDWITPAVRVGVGLAVGFGLILAGMRIYGERRAFSRVLLGGGIGALYVTGYAAYVLYALVPHAAAFAFMVAVTLLAFAMALRQDAVSLSLIGTTGGLATPFVLSEGREAVSALVLYACLVLAGVCAVYLYRGWRSLLLLACAGTWAVLLLGYRGLGYPASEAALLELASLQAGVALCWLLPWLASATREALRSRRPSRWPVPEPGRVARVLFGGDERLLRSVAPAYLVAVTAPLVALAFSQEIWTLHGEDLLGWLALAAAAVYVLAWGVLRRVGRSGSLAYAHALVALLLGTLALALVLEGDALYFALAAEATVLHLVSRRLADRIVSFGAHALSAVVLVWLAGRLSLGALENAFSVGPSRAPFLDSGALSDLAVVALLFVSSVAAMPRSVARSYRLAAHAAALGLLFRELILLPHGGSLALVSWAAYATGLLLISRRRREWGSVAGAHVVWGVVALWLAARLAGGISTTGFPEAAFFDPRSIADLCVVALAAGSAFVRVGGSGHRVVYLLLAHAALLAWLWRELWPLPGGEALVTVAWGAYAALLLVAGLRLDLLRLVRAGLGTLLLVVAKLLLVDLAGVEPVWRILLFLGFGATFLLLGYYLPRLWRPGSGRSLPRGDGG